MFEILRLLQCFVFTNEIEMDVFNNDILIMNFKECKTFHASRKTKETGGNFCICNRTNYWKYTGDDQIISEKQKKKPPNISISLFEQRN